MQYSLVTFNGQTSSADAATVLCSLFRLLQSFMNIVLEGQQMTNIFTQSQSQLSRPQALFFK